MNDIEKLNLANIHDDFALFVENNQKHQRK